MEMVIALSIITLIFATVLPQFRLINNSWNTKQANSEVLQNGRVLIDHINRNLSKAVMITSVSNSSSNDGYIEFEDNDGNNLRYAIGASNYVQFGPVDSLADLAGPVSALSFTCYDDTDFDTAITDGNSIRLVDISAILENPVNGQQKTFTTSVYLRTGKDTECTSGLVGWWKLDDGAGTTAIDSSDYENHGTLVNGPSWTTGQLGGALNFDGTNDYVDFGNDESLQITDELTIAAWVKLGSGSSGGYYGIAGKLRHTPYAGFALVRHSSNYFYFWISDGSTLESVSSNSTYTDTNWHHVAAVRRDGVNYLYIDGVQQTATNTRAIQDSGDYAFIGRQYSNLNDRYFNGTIDEVRIYNRGLEPEEVAQLANVLRYREFTETKVGTANTSITINTPSTDEDDLLIAAVATYGATNTSLSPPSGQNWTLINVGNRTSGVTLGAWWKLAGASEAASHQFTWTGSQQAYGWMMRFSGHDLDNPINVSTAGGATSSTPTSPAVTTTVDNCLILRLGGFQNDNITEDDPGLSGHTAITMDKSASSSGGVALLGSWTTGLTKTAVAGSNRALIFIAHAEYSSSLNLSAVTYGGRAMTKVVERNYLASSGYAYTVAYILKESGIAAASSSTFSVTWNVSFAGNTPPAYSSAFFSNVDQTTSTAATGTGGSTSNPLTTSSSLATASGDMVILGATCGNEGSYTLNNGFTEGSDQTQGTGYGLTGVTGHKAATGANETPSATYSSTINRQGIIGFVLKGDAVTDTVSGGAGYITQASAGSSGTSTFALTASDYARMITIGIAPQQDDTASCYAEIRP